jgi:phage terminase small subunit
LARPKLSKAIHDARGHLGKRASTQQRADLEIKPAPADPPPQIAEDADAVAVWNALIHERLDKGLHTLFDVHAFARYCACTAEFWRSMKDVRDRGSVATLLKGGEKKAPAVEVAAKMHSMQLDFEDRNGGSPKARGQINVAPPVPDADAAKHKKYG